MRHFAIAALAAACGLLVGMSAGQAADTIKWNPIDIEIQLGTKAGAKTILPRRIRLEEGKLYRLTITNPSPTTHYFWAPFFAAFGTETIYIDVGTGDFKRTAAGPWTEQYRTPEIEVPPSGTAVWEFVPVVDGVFEAGCSRPAHSDAGMNLRIDVH